MPFCKIFLARIITKALGPVVETDIGNETPCLELLLVLCYWNFYWLLLFQFYGSCCCIKNRNAFINIRSLSRGK